MTVSPLTTAPSRHRDRLSITQVSTWDIAGGAEKVAWDLFRAYRARGHRSRLVVGYRRCDDPDVVLLPHAQVVGPLSRLCWALERTLHRSYLRSPHVDRLGRWLRRLAAPSALRDTYHGREVFSYPGTARLLDMEPQPPDLLHCHNLHGDYFDLRSLPAISQRVPVVLSAHDTWLLAGHCALSFDCERWKTGCGRCPDLTIYPSVRRDATAENWQRKRDIYARSRIYLATPSSWLMQRMQQSMLMAAVAQARVIPHGVDLSVFHPADRADARRELGFPREGKMLLFVANGIRRNPWKDYATLRAAVARVSEQFREGSVLTIGLGEDGPAERTGKAEVRFVPFQTDPHRIARYYQAADVYVHATRVETFGMTVAEALACGIPVVATAAGAIPEVIEDGTTGFLTPLGDASAMVTRVLQLLRDRTLAARMGHCAAEAARRRFDLNRQVDEFLAWYEDVIADWEGWRRHGAATALC